MRRHFLLILLMAIAFSARADHITGGEMFYTYLGRDGENYKYEVTLKLFMRCNSGRRFNNPATISVFDKGSYTRIQNFDVELNGPLTLSLNNSNPCITNPPVVCFEVGYYNFTVTLPSSVSGYILSSQVNYRIAGINNLAPGYGLIGAVYTAEIPGNSEDRDLPENNSANFVGSDLVVICANNSFSYSFAAQDKDGDQLVYSFCEAYVSGTTGTNAPPLNPPYFSVPYGQGFNANMPLGEHVQLDASTGLIRGIAPPAGTYVITVCVQEVRNGVVIATQRKDFQVNVTECSIAAASLIPDYKLCKDSKTLSLGNQSNSPLIKTYDWKLFNSDGTKIYSSTAPTIRYEFPDTGLYKLTLLINQGLPCSDSINSVVKVYPGLNADFNFSGICLAKPTSFTDQSTTVFGDIKSWYWNFDDPYVYNDTANEKDPVYTYFETGTKNVSLIVNTTIGCSDTITKPVTIVTKPPIHLAFRDTLICKGDTLQLKAEVDGQLNWHVSPHMISSPNGPPLVYPSTSTYYVVDLNDNGCRNKDSVLVRVVDHVQLQMKNDTVICQGDVVQLEAITDALYFQWTPSQFIENPTRLVTNAYPPITTNYNLSAAIGHCNAEGTYTVTVVPYPKVNAGADTVICHAASCQLNGSTNGSSFLWSPAVTISDINHLSPVVFPKSSTSYVLTAYDTIGCPKPATDTILVTVLPKIIADAGNDTAALIGQPLQLQATGGITYQWSPASNLSDANSSNPVAIFPYSSNGLRYRVLVYNESGCVDSAFLTIKIFSTPPTVFVPTGFTPNNDGKNDLLKPIAVGISKIEYFRVYNRWGQLVFSTTTNNNGWDGKVSGKEQPTSTFVWEVKATDYLGTPYIQKGIVTLIR